MTRYAQPLGRLGDPGPVRRTAHMKHGVIVACRLGDPLHPHALVVAGTRHDYLGGRMELTRLGLEHVEVLPGNIGVMMDRLAHIMPTAERRSREGLGKHMLIVDQTRQQSAHRLMMERLTVDVLLLVTTHGRQLEPSVPYYTIGRVGLLSELTVQLGRPGVVSILEPATDVPTVLRPQQVRDALGAAQNRPPKEEPDAFVTETTTQDDVALAIAATALWAERGAPDPWVEAPAYVAA